MLGIKKPNDNVKRKRCMIYPNDTSKLWWDVFISLILLISTFTTPIDIAFTDTLSQNPRWFWFSTSLDIAFLVDILVTFNSAMQDSSFDLIDSRAEVANIYLRTWFIIDVVAIIPLDQLIANDMNSLVRITRVGKLYKLIKVTRLVRLIKII